MKCLDLNELEIFVFSYGVVSKVVIEVQQHTAEIRIFLNDTEIKMNDLDVFFDRLDKFFSKIIGYVETTYQSGTIVVRLDFPNV